MKVRVLALAIMLPLAAAGCSQTLSGIGTVLTLNQPQFLDNALLGKMHASYQVFLAGSLSIRNNFPQCKAGQSPSPSALCYKREQYLALQTLTRQVQQSITNIDEWARNNPTIDAGALIDAFNRVIGQGTALVTSIQSGSN